MGKILDAFLSDQLNIDLTTQEENPEYQKLCKKVHNLQEQLRSTLNDEEIELLEHLMNAMMDEGYYYAQLKFIRGYQLGVLMTSEVFSARDTFIPTEDSKN